MYIGCHAPERMTQPTAINLAYCS